MTWLQTLERRIKAVIPSTANPTQKKVFLEWLQLCREIDKEHVDQLSKLRTTLRDIGTHKEDCESVKVPGRFGSRSGLRWHHDQDWKNCNCGFAKALT